MWLMTKNNRVASQEYGNQYRHAPSFFFGRQAHDSHAGDAPSLNSADAPRSRRSFVVGPFRLNHESHRTNFVGGWVDHRTAVAREFLASRPTGMGIDGFRRVGKRLHKPVENLAGFHVLLGRLRKSGIAAIILFLPEKRRMEKSAV
jgi:hypothetical protein